jgi:nitrogen fixation/metabolism regulation signal transduction histidine kinase
VINPLRAIGNGMELLREQDFSSRLRRVHQKDADRIVEVFNRMITQLKEERLHVRETNQFLDLLINASPMGVVIMDFDGHVTSLNPAAEKFIECTAADIRGKKIGDMGTSLADNLATLGKDAAETFQMNDSHIYRCSRLSFVDHGYAHPFFLIESLTDEVMKAEKKAYEKVIRMIAHEVNNTTAGITSTLDSVSQALQDVPDTADLREVMAACIERSYSMSRFITRFADVVKIPEPQLQPCDINTLVDTCLQVMETNCSERDIRLQRQYAPSPIIVNVDTTLMEQVIVNIIKNAAESIGHGGCITVSTAPQPAMLEIADNGAGISGDAAQKLFSPFFSTKPNGQGIGLIFIREVLTRHHFRFSLKTYPDGITRFRIIMF